MSTDETMSLSVGPSKRTRPTPAPPGLTSWDLLPETLIREVALCLSLKDCFSATRVSKTWHTGINRVSTWKQYILREWPGMHVVMSRLEADALEQSELCKSFRELYIKMLKSFELEASESDTRSAGDYKRLHDGGDENWSNLFTDVFLLVHVTNRHTNRVLHSTLQGLSDPEVIARLFCQTGRGWFKLSGVLEHELDAFLDYKVTLLLVDLRRAGVRVAQLIQAWDLLMENYIEILEGDDPFAVLTCFDESEVSDNRLYSLGLESYPEPVFLEYQFLACPLGRDMAGKGTQGMDAEKIWELEMLVEFHVPGPDVTNRRCGRSPHSFDDASAAYELLEPFVQSPSLLEWH